MEVAFLGGIRYDVAEMQLRDKDGDERYQLRVRASGTEPINRVYVESKDPEQGKVIMEAALGVLEDLTIEEIRKAYSIWRLVDMLSQSRFTEKTLSAVLKTIEANDWEMAEVAGKLVKTMGILEDRNRKIAAKWLEALTK
jgi:hypothetical protein